jgi:hypothetical protein
MQLLNEVKVDSIATITGVTISITITDSTKKLNKDDTIPAFPCPGGYNNCSEKGMIYFGTTN